MRGSALLVAMAIGSCRSAGESSPSGPATASASPSTSPPASTSTPAPTASDPCARTADLDARAAEAQSLYGATVRTAVVDGAFLFVDADHGALFDDATRFAPRVLAAYHHERVGPAPLCPVTVTLFSSHARFLVHCASRGYPVAGVDNLGLYDPLRREIVADLSGGASHLPTIAHELLHPLMDADFGGAPRWFRECVGTLYEAPVLREG